MKFQFSDTIALTALIISLVSIWLQSRSSQQQLLVANISEYTKRYQEIVLNLPRDVLNDDFDIANFSEEEQSQILRYMWIYFDLCFEEYMLHFHLRLVNKKLWSIWDSGMRLSLSRRSFSQCWWLISRNSSYDVNSRFKDFMNSIAHYAP
jgi:hypothetical protein